MSARHAMIMRAVVQIPTSATDDYGQPGPATWATTGNPAACWAWSETKEVSEAHGKIALVEDFRCLFPRGYAIQDEYRLLRIQDRQGIEVFAGPIYIESIQVR